MKPYLGRITLVKNGRGLYCLDTTMGCKSGVTDNPNGCYGACYAASRAKIYGHDFGKTTVRRFDNAAHLNSTVKAIYVSDMPFVRIGCSGDPSEAWEHTVQICEQLWAGLERLRFDVFMDRPPKYIVIITRHWEILTDDQLSRLGKIGVCVNTSVSAIDSKEARIKSLYQYNRLKPFLHSVLRIVSFDFNIRNERAAIYSEIQRELFQNEDVIDTVFRCSPKHELVMSGTINIARVNFMGNIQWASRLNRKAYLGKCDTCPDVCGLNKVLQFKEVAP